MRTISDLVDAHMMGDVSHPVFVGVYDAVSRAVFLLDESATYVFVTEFGPTVVAAESPRRQACDGTFVPGGLRFYVIARAPTPAAALEYMTYVVSRAYTLYRIAANAAGFPPHLRLIYEFGAGDIYVRQTKFEPEIAHPLNSRAFDLEATAAFFHASRHNPEERLDRAMVQYVDALHAWDIGREPIALNQVWMGMEALTEAMIARQIANLRLADWKALADSLGVATASDRWREELKIAVRRLIICGGDATTYQALKRHSDGLEHGFNDFGQMWAFADETFWTGMRYLRNAIVACYDLPDPAASRLTGPPFDDPVRRGETLACEAHIAIDQIDLRNVDFDVLAPERVMTAFSYDPDRREFTFSYELRRTQ